MMQTNIKSTVGSLFNQVTGLLPESPTARLDAEVLTAYACQLTREQLITHDRTEVSPGQYNDLHQLVKRRQQGEPIAYLTGKQEFYSLALSVNRATLIPRPETELLVDLALEQIPPNMKNAKNTHMNIIDLGTGCGAIALAIASHRPDCNIIATDNSEEALQLAAENAAKLSIRNIEFRQGHWFEALDNEMAHIIVSNPPYIAAGDPHLSRGDIRYEPGTALVSRVGESVESDGLDDIRQIAKHAQDYLLPGGILMLEHGAEQAHKVHNLMVDAGGNCVACYQDLAGLDRVSTCFFRK